PRSDEALLVRKREGDPVLQRPERRVDAREADDRVQDEVGLRSLEQLDDVATDLEVLDAEARRDLVERLRAGRQRTQRELGIRGDDLERLAPDGSGRSEQGDASLAHVRRLTAAVFSHGYAFPKARIVKNAA